MRHGTAAGDRRRRQLGAEQLLVRRPRRATPGTKLASSWLVLMARWGSVACLALPVLLGLSHAQPPPATGDGDGVVHAVLFASPTCPHCRKVIREVLPPLLERFEGRFQVGVLSTATPAGQDLYRAAYRRFAVRLRGVPLLVVGDTALVGSDEIPRRLPGLVAGYLAEGGAGWPDIPGLAEVLAWSSAPPPTLAPSSTPMPRSRQTGLPRAAPAGAGPVPRPAAPSSRPTVAAAPTIARATEAEAAAGIAVGGAQDPTPSASVRPGLISVEAGAESGFLDHLHADPYGNGLALLVLFGMTVAVVRSVALLRQDVPVARGSRFDALNPVLAVAGLGVAAYLAHVEVREIEAVCGPVGDCNTVQRSEYARLFGVLPLGVLGVVGFVAILLGWAVRRFGTGRTRAGASVALLGLTGFGTLFSIYLTFLEPFVIGATCLWCLSSAVIMTALYGLALTPGQRAAARIHRRPAPGLSRHAT